MVAAIKDSSLDYRTYWLQGGQYYERRPLMGALDTPCTLPADKLRQIPEADRKVLLDEVNADPAFCRRVAKCMATNPNWAHVIASSAKEAIVNEMDPQKFPARRGTWPKLRELARALVEDASTISRSALDAAVKAKPGGKPLAGLSGLGQWDIVASLVGSIAGVGANIYGSILTSHAQQSIARTNANAAMAQAGAAMNIANANAAMAVAQQRIDSPISSAFSALTSTTIAGIPIIVPILGAAGLALYLAFNKK